MPPTHFLTFSKILKTKEMTEVEVKIDTGNTDLVVKVLHERVADVYI